VSHGESAPEDGAGNESIVRVSTDATSEWPNPEQLDGKSNSFFAVTAAESVLVLS
jgi:hypothetical protein